MSVSPLGLYRGDSRRTRKLRPGDSSSVRMSCKRFVIFRREKVLAPELKRSSGWLLGPALGPLFPIRAREGRFVGIIERIHYFGVEPRDLSEGDEAFAFEGLLLIDL